MKACQKRKNSCDKPITPNTDTVMKSKISDFNPTDPCVRHQAKTVHSSIAPKSITAVFCKTCSRYFDDSNAILNHYTSADHKKKEAWLQERKDGKKDDIICSICKMSFHSRQSKNEHINSNKHKHSLNALKEFNRDNFLI